MVPFWRIFDARRFGLSYSADRITRKPHFSPAGGSFTAG
jgi:hypothetical protein